MKIMEKQWKAKRIKLLKNSDLTSSGWTLTPYSNRIVLLLSSNKNWFWKTLSVKIFKGARIKCTPLYVQGYLKTVEISQPLRFLSTLPDEIFI